MSFGCYNMFLARMKQSINTKAKQSKARQSKANQCKAKHARSNTIQKQKGTDGSLGILSYDCSTAAIVQITYTHIYICRINVTKRQQF